MSVSHDLLHRPTRIELPDGEVQLLAYDGSSDAAAMASSAGWASWLVLPSDPPGPAPAPTVDMGLDAPRSTVAAAAAPNEPPQPRLGQQVVVDDFGRLIALYTDTTGWEHRRYDQ